jgi:hypothetical protein
MLCYIITIALIQVINTGTFEVRLISTMQPLIFILCVAVACSVGTSALANTDYLEIEWIQLMPADDLQALLNPPDFLADIEDGGSEDTIESLDTFSTTDKTALRFEQALTSTRVIEAFDNAHIRLPGFIVPLESDEQQRITQFFIVPYFGACLHMPPPPPNQIIYSESKPGIELLSLYDAFWFEGTLLIDYNEKLLGNSAYTLRLDRVSPFED